MLVAEGMRTFSYWKASSASSSTERYLPTEYTSRILSDAPILHLVSSCDMSTRVALSQIVRLALIKVMPGAFNIALIPYLLATLGSANYGLYSTWLSYAMLVANALAAVASQPMYRYLSSNPLEREAFASFALGAAGVAGLAGLGVTITVGAPWLLALGFGFFSVGTVLGTAISIDLVISAKIARLAIYETVRILVISLALLIPSLSGAELGVGHVVLAMALSNVPPIFLLADRHRFRRLNTKWLRRVASYGFKSAIWLMLAGLPLVSAKSILMQTMPENAFGTYAAIADLTYRGFAIANAALMMWAFPRLSQQFDEGRIYEVHRTLRFALLTYALGGIALLSGVVAVINRLSWFDVSALPGGLIAAVAITLASFSWQGMSIAHKTFELTLRTSRMAALMAVAVLVFYVLTYSLPYIANFEVLYVITFSMIVVAIIYILASLNQKVNN